MQREFSSYLKGNSTRSSKGNLLVVAPQLTVVLSTTAPRDAEAQARDARAASQEFSVAAQEQRADFLQKIRTLPHTQWATLPLVLIDMKARYAHAPEQARVPDCDTPDGRSLCCCGRRLDDSDVIGPECTACCSL